MTKDQTQAKKPKPSRFTVAPLYLAAGLAVCYVVLTQMVPALSGMADDTAKTRPPELAWQSFTVQLSNSVRANPSAWITAFAIIAIAGFVVSILLRPLRFLVWILALAVFLLDVGFAAGAWWSTISGLLREANNLGR